MTIPCHDLTETNRECSGEAALGEGGSRMQDAQSRPPQIALNYWRTASFSNFIDFTCATS